MRVPYLITEHSVIILLRLYLQPVELLDFLVEHDIHAHILLTLLYIKYQFVHGALVWVLVS